MILNIIKNNTNIPEYYDELICNIDWETIWLKKIPDNKFSELKEEINKTNDDYLIVFYGCLTFLDMKFSNEKLEIVTYRHIKVNEKLKKSLENVISTEDDKNKYHLIKLYLKIINDKDLSIIKDYIISKYNFESLSILLDSKKVVIKEFQKEIKQYLSSLSNIDFINDDKFIDRLESLFNQLKIDTRILIDRKNSIKNHKDDKIRNMKMSEISIDIEVDNLYMLNYDESFRKCLENLPKQVDSHFTKIIKINKDNYIQNDFDVIDIKKYFCLMQQLIDKIDDDFTKSLVSDVNNSNISDFYKEIIIKILSTDVDIMFKIDSLSDKFEGIIREHLKSKNINTTYVDNGKSEEKTLSISKNGLLSILISEYPCEEKRITLLNNILNDRIFHNIRNKSSHSLINEKFYSENNYKLLLICLREIINILK